MVHVLYTVFSGKLMSTRVSVAGMTPDLRTPLYNGQNLGPSGGSFIGVPLYSHKDGGVHVHVRMSSEDYVILYVQKHYVKVLRSSSN